MDSPVAVHLPPELVRQVDAVARDELRSRANTVKWLLSQALEQREPVEVVEPAEAG
jgi:metal-responsive CopG/Arc/MetJ family transcriptional regulator